jgi:hypothetical protein
VLIKGSGRMGVALLASYCFKRDPLSFRVDANANLSLQPLAFFMTDTLTS